MAASEGIILYGAEFKWNSATLGEVTAYQGPETSLAEVDFTHTASPDNHSEKRPGFNDSTPMKVTCNYEEDAYGTLHAAQLARTQATAAFELADGATISSTNCWISKLQTSGGDVKGRVEMSFEVTAPGKWTFTAPA